MKVQLTNIETEGDEVSVLVLRPSITRTIVIPVPVRVPGTYEPADSPSPIKLQT
jgi:hypothetical protein